MTRPPLSALTKLPVPSKARDEIAHLDALLAAFNHRNRNQHRLSPWWSRFSILRRALRGLSRGGNSDAVPREDVVWLRDAIVPRCYVSFSQLAADNQHAALGLMLLVVIARVNTIINDLLPLGEELAPAPPALEIPAEKTSKTSNSAPTQEADKGVKIQRIKPKDTPEIVSSSEPAKKKRGDVPLDEPKKKKKKKSKDEFSSLFGSLA